MGRQIVGVVVGLAVWLVAVLAAGVVLRSVWPEYVAASGDMSFTLPMKLTRLSIGAVATLTAGAAAALIARSNWTAVAAGAFLLVGFIPQHVSLWDKFPVWYHLTFLTSLVPLAFLGGRIVGQRAGRRRLADV
jgi:hypothetical protein